MAIIGPFTSSINEATSAITVVKGSEKLMLSTADGVKAKEAVMFASSLLDVSALPEFIAYSPFRLRFLADGGAALCKEGFGFVSFDKTTYEDLIKIIGMTVDQCCDALRIRGGAKAGLNRDKTADPVI